MSGPTIVQINANWPDLTPDQYDRLIEYGKTCVLAGAAAEGAPLRETIARLERELAEAKARETDWINHPETIESKRQWDAVAIALGADKDCPDSVLSAAKARAIPDGWVAVPAEPTPEMLRAGFLSESEGFDIETPGDAPGLVYRAMIAARPQPKGGSNVE